NPEYGATLDFYLAEAPADDATLTIEDEAGTVVRTLPVSAHAGLNRVVWDLTHTPSKRPRLRTPALEHSHVGLGDEEWRPPVDGGTVRPLAVPGEYRVRLAVDGEERTTTLTVLQDPASRGTAADMRAQLDMQLELREMTDSTAALIDRVEWTRKGLLDLRVRLRGDSAYDDVVAAGEALHEALVELEMRLFDLRLSGGTAGQDTIRWPRRLFAKLTSLAGYASGTDHPPTEQAGEVRDRYRVELSEVLARWAELADGDIAHLNRMLTGRGLLPVISEP
ncbi:MAG: hypothetical protein OEZ37_07220, partial [Gemmatimonadota bacterium]|nr:hypothetical protein [Gemmatimonadota bacterium]